MALCIMSAVMWHDIMRAEVQEGTESSTLSDFPFVNIIKLGMYSPCPTIAAGSLLGLCFDPWSTVALALNKMFAERTDVTS